VGAKQRPKAEGGNFEWLNLGKGWVKKKGACVGRYERESGPTGGRGMKRGLQTCERVTGEAENFLCGGGEKKQQQMSQRCKRVNGGEERVGYGLKLGPRWLKRS